MAHGLPCWLDGYWDTEPDIPRIAKGVKDRVSRLKALGNAVVPVQAYPIFWAIAEIEKRSGG
jgi:DNA (cytosine-5)-methyltransferase 1